MYNLHLSKQVVKFINARTPKERVRIAQAFEQLQHDPFHNHLDIKKLTGSENKYRLRLGNYRLLYEIVQDLVLIYCYKADTRGDVYK